MNTYTSEDLNVNNLSEKYDISVSTIRSLDQWFIGFVPDSDLTIAANAAVVNMAEKYNVPEQDMREILLNRAENARVFRKTNRNIKLIFKSLFFIVVAIAAYFYFK